MRTASRIKLLTGTFFLLLASISSPAQKTQALLSTTVRSIRVGEPFPVQLEVIHPADVIVIFPDSATGFQPFELYKRKSQDTRTENGVSRDIGNFDLMAWELDSLQHLVLEVKLVKGKDTTLLESNGLDIHLEKVIKVWSDSLRIKAIPGLAEVPEPLNKRAILIIILLVTLAVILSVVFLRKPIAYFFRRRKVDREWQKYSARLREVLRQVQQQEYFIRELNYIWKNYFDRNRKYALTSLTTPELKPALEHFSQLGGEEKNVLANASQAAEMIVFAGIPYSEKDLTNLHTLISEIMEREYGRRKEAAKA